ncbi:TPA: hypothetical protein ACX6PJ_001581 [Photobacterium damselae]
MKKSFLISIISFVSIPAFAQGNFDMACSGSIMKDTNVHSIIVEKDNHNYLVEFESIPSINFTIGRKSHEGKWIKNALLNDDSLNICINSNKEILSIELVRQ